MSIIESLLSIGKILIKSRPTPGFSKFRESKLLIIGNGPSAKELLKKGCELGFNAPMLCVNKFAYGDSFHILKPKYYLLLDADFYNFDEAVFADPSSHPRVKIKPAFTEWQNQINETWRSLYTQNWGLTLFVPTAYKNSIWVKKAKENNIKIQHFNYSVIKGFNGFKNLCYKLGLGMPQSQNVINAALFLGIKMHVKYVFIAGIDHDFHRNLILDNHNVLYESVSHFYTEEAFKHPLVHADGSGPVKLRQVFLNLHKVHLGYQELHRFAMKMGAQIFNITPGGYVDEFPRKSESEVINL